MSGEANVRTLTIDGVDVSARPDQTILEAAREHDIKIPTLCQIEGLSSVGSCRLCLVEVKGARRLQPACVTRVEEGMEVITHSAKIDRYRTIVLELFFAERNHVCSVCVANGRCELQSLALSLGMTHVELPYQYPQLPVDASHPRFTVDHNRCVLCTRCVRVCSEVEGANTWGVMGRGGQSLVITDLKEPWGASETCTSCGKCVQVCPTGALFEKNRAISKARKHPEFLPYLRIMREGDRHDSGREAMSELKTLATVWLDGCSGCHMSLLDMDERLIELSSQFQLVFSPLVDRKAFPERVDVTLVEGAVASEDDLKKIRKIREHTTVLVSLGDCALTGNVSAMRNMYGPLPVLERVYQELVDLQPEVPTVGVPALLDRVRPVHEVVPVDVFVPGCPPSADTIYQVLSELLAGHVPTLGGIAHFG